MKTRLRSSLKKESNNTILRIALLSEDTFDPLPAVANWLEKCGKRERTTVTQPGRDMAEDFDDVNDTDERFSGKISERYPGSDRYCFRNKYCHSCLNVCICPKIRTIQ